MWYAGLVGELVPFLREEHDCYLSREPAGYVNIVKKSDAEVVGVSSAPVGIFNGPVVVSAQEWPSKRLGPQDLRLYEALALRNAVLLGQLGKGEKVQRYIDTKAKW
jgi:hypothetical protein